MAKSFLFLIGLAAILGVGLGGAFIGGMAFGKSQEDTTANVQSVAAFGPAGAPGAGSAGRNQPGGFQQGSTTPGLDAQTEAEGDSPFQGRQGNRGGGDGAMARGDLMGTVESIEGDNVTINTPQGPVQARLSGETTITRIAPAGVEELEVGAQVRVTGEEAVVAASVTIIPEGIEGLMGRGISGE